MCFDLLGFASIAIFAQRYFASFPKGDYFLCRQSDMVHIAKWLKGVELDTKDKYQFCMAPISTKNLKAKEVLIKFAEKLAAGEV